MRWLPKQEEVEQPNKEKRVTSHYGVCATSAITDAVIPRKFGCYY